MLIAAAAGLVLAAATPAAPTEAQLSQALGQVLGAEPRLAGIHCQPGSRGFVRCTYLQLKGAGYSRWAVLVSPHGDRWTVSEGPIPEAANPVRRKR